MCVPLCLQMVFKWAMEETTWRCWEGFAPVPSTTCQTACFLNCDLTTHRPFRSDMANGSSPAAPHFFCLDMSCNKLTTWVQVLVAKRIHTLFHCTWARRGIQHESRGPEATPAVVTIPRLQIRHKPCHFLSQTSIEAPKCSPKCSPNAALIWRPSGHQSNPGKALAC